MPAYACDDAWDFIVVQGFMMAACYERILASRCSNFLLAARHLANNPLALFKVGDEVEYRRCVSVKDVQAFADISGDTNPIHYDDKFARKSRAGQVIVHGVILNGYSVLFLAVIILEYSLIFVVSYRRYFLKGFESHCFCESSEEKCFYVER